MHGGFENLNRKATLAAYWKAMRAEAFGVAGAIRTANPDLATRFDLIDAEVGTTEGDSTASPSEGTAPEQEGL
jgi:hypothetical protein